jgi:hypothetical protein
VSQRNSREAKRARRLRREITSGTHKTQIDLIQWVKARSSVTTGMAEKIIKSGALMIDSHPIGIRKVGDRTLLVRYVPAEWSSRIQIVMPEALQ